MSEPSFASTPSVAAPSGIELAAGVFAPGDAVRFQYARSGGPGGQNVNKVNTKAEIWVRISAITGLSPGAVARLSQFAGKRLTASGEIHFASETERGQEGNRQAVMERLRDLIERARIEPKPRRRTRPSRAAKARRMDQKKRRGQIKAARRSPKKDQD
jgi:ribosome-associated protein